MATLTELKAEAARIAAALKAARAAARAEAARLQQAHIDAVNAANAAFAGRRAGGQEVIGHDELADRAARDAGLAEAAARDAAHVALILEDATDAGALAAIGNGSRKTVMGRRARYAEFVDLRNGILDVAAIVAAARAAAVPAMLGGLVI